MTGTVGMTEIMAAYREVVTHPAWEHGFSILTDVSTLHALDVLLEDIETFEAEVGTLAALRGPGRSALVTTNPAIHLNALLLARKGRRSEGWVFRVFGRRDEAEAWLAAEGHGAAPD